MAALLAAALLVAQLAQSPLHAHAGSPTHRDLFAPVFVLKDTLTARDSKKQSVAFTLPGDATDREGHWYVLDAKLRLTFKHRASTAGPDYLWIMTNGYATARIEFRVGSLGVAPVARWSSYDLFVGRSAGLVVGKRLNLGFRNYLQVPGVRPGGNSLSIKVEQTAGRSITSAALERGSAIEVGPLAPPAFRLAVRPFVRRLKVGATLDVSYRLLSEGLPARGVGVLVATTCGALMESTPLTRFFPWVSDSVGTVRFVVLGRGDCHLILSARGATGGTAAAMLAVSLRRIGPSGRLSVTTVALKR